MKNQKLKDQIFKAADELCAQGIQKPTNDQVRNRLGGGSLSQISPVMREWRELQKKSQDVVADMPEGLRKIVESALSQVWLSANEIATEGLARHKMKSDEAVSQVSQERDELLAELDGLEAKMHELMQAKEEVVAQTIRLESELTEKNDRLLKLEVEASGLKSTLAAKDSEVLDLKNRLDEAQEDNRVFKAQLLEIVRSSAKSEDQG